MTLDSIDRRILMALQSNGRLSNQDLADLVSLSPSACLRRVKFLEKEGFILGYHASLNTDKLGFEIEAIVHISLDQSNPGWHEDFLLQIEALPEIMAAYIVTGAFNYILHIRTQNFTHFSDFVVEKLNKIVGMRDIRSHIVMKKMKDTKQLLSLDMLP